MNDLTKRGLRLNGHRKIFAKLPLPSYLSEALSRTVKSLAEKQNTCVVLPPGTGLMILASLIVDWLASQNENVLVIVERAVQRDQFSTSYKEWAVSKADVYIMTGIDSLNRHKLANHDIAVTTKHLLTQNLEILSHFNTLVGIDIEFGGVKLSNKTSVSKITESNLQKRLLLAPFPPTGINRSIFGDVSYEYSFSRAMVDGIFCPIEYYTSEIIKDVESNNRDYIEVVLTKLLAKLDELESKKILIVCQDTEQGKLIFSILKTTQSVVFADKESENELNEFGGLGGKIRIAVTVDKLIIGFDCPELTDIIIFRDITSGKTANYLIAKVAKPFEGKKVGRIWNLKGEKIFFDEHFSEYYPIEIDIPSAISNQPEPIISASHKRIAPVGDLISDKDLLGRERLIHVLSGVIEYNSGNRVFRPFVIGLFGKWGSGKTTFVSLLKNKLNRNDNYRFIDFNCWQNEHCNHMGAALAECIVSDLYGSKNIFKRIQLLLKEKVVIGRDWLFLVAVLVLLTSLGLAVFASINKAGVVIWSITGIAGVLSLAATYSKGLLNNPFTKQLGELLKRPSFKEHLGIANKIKQNIKSLFEAYGKLKWFSVVNNKQFIVVVDDLDRCDSEKIIEVIEAVKLIIDLDNVVVILAVDREILHRAVADRYSKQNSNLEQEEIDLLARNYLGKVLQLTIELNDPAKNHVDRFVSERLYPGVGTTVPVTETRPEKAHEDDQVVEDINTVQQIFSEVDAEEIAEDLDLDDEYINSSDVEASYFKVCIGLFDSHNPRTLIRMHNILLMLKGLHPEIIDEEKLLKLHIFLVFFVEYYASSSSDDRKLLDSVAFKKQDNLGLKDRMLELDQEFESEFNTERNSPELKRYLMRVARLSLPCPQMH